MNSTSLFDTSNFMPHGMCYLWQADILWTSVVSDVVTALAYFSITIAMVIFVRKRHDLPYPWFFTLAGSIIFMACGTSHLVSAIVIWEPIYGVSAIVKAVTAVASLATGIVIWFVLPFFLSIPSPSMLARKNVELQESLDKLTIAQASLVESEKMASLGGLVTGIAHEINTPLGVAITAVSLAKESIDKLKDNLSNNTLTKKQLAQYKEGVEKSTELIESNLNRTAHLVDNFKQIAIDHSDESLRSYNLREYINKVLVSLKSVFKENSHKITVQCDADINIYGTPSDITQIMTNLIMNTFKHGFEHMNNGDIAIEVQKKEQNVTFTYTDSGCGIPQQDMLKLFDPFFTTKRGSGNPGLGLYIVYNLVTQSLNGNIECNSEVGKGVKFNISFPFSSQVIASQ